MIHSDIFVDNDSVLILDGLKDRTVTPVLGATVTLQDFKDFAGNVVPGIGLPAPFNEIGGGRYELALSRSIGLVSGKRYRLTVRAESGGVRGEWIEIAIAKTREA